MYRSTLQNRVDPFGQLHAVPHQGALMGNRGILHDGEQRIRRQWERKAWVTCVLSYGNVQRAVFSPNNYSELFFLDEATSFAAGHRPCHTCQRERYDLFRHTWLEANMPEKDGTFVPVTEIDRVMHAERALRGGKKRSFEVDLAELPCGTMYEHDGEACLVWQRGMLRWSFEGYVPVTSAAPTGRVRVLTPPSVVRMFRAGFLPRVHASADL
jgi:hypothetical protein